MSKLSEDERRRIRRDNKIISDNRGLCPVCYAADGSEGCDGEEEGCPFEQPLTENDK